ncbi:hypothetical protein CS063_14950 [Sporanaerobium hydrogeniformans]|uniref:Uncharacterized protein n=1 Tax=Sporanaerobium hydrogeniformans TaxID=3072179 RepID=A0AC61D7R8_9FIRM|nr:GTP-binding protein [Sporanaerobium hydrogeniformans]PHV69604.1 hypothetical protein CS063_14950 [Sporanaerobium hydrogeniformans]
MIKLDIVSGFKGSGKTTLIELLEDLLWRDERLVILQNEFGKKTLSPRYTHHFLEQISGGCICCTSQILLQQCIYQLIESHHPQRIVIEVPETASLSDIGFSLTENLKDICQLDHMLYVMDVPSFQKRLQLSEGFIRQQIRKSSLLFLHHLESALPTEKQALLEFIHTYSPHSFISSRSWGELQKQEVCHLYEQSRIKEAVYTPMIRMRQPAPLFTEYSDIF